MLLDADNVGIIYHYFFCMYVHITLYKLLVLYCKESTNPNNFPDKIQDQNILKKCVHSLLGGDAA